MATAYPIQPLFPWHVIGQTSSGSRAGWSRRIFPQIAMLSVVGILATALPTTAQMVEERDSDNPPSERPSAVPEKTTPGLMETEALIVEQTNAFRKKEKLAALTTNENLNATAQYFADYMARTGKYGHKADDQRPSERASNHGYDYCIVAENIAYQFRSTGFTAKTLAERFVSGWKQSPGHRDNMLDPHVTETGVAVARRKGDSAYYAVQMFGRPDSRSISFRVRNASDTPVEYTVRRRGSEKAFSLPPRLRRTHRRCRPTEVEFKTPSQTIEADDGAVMVIEQAAPGELQAKIREMEAGK